MKENVKAQELFNEQFKFNLNQEVRHKGDNKNAMSSDMGLLVLRRSLEENSDDDGNVHYTRNYICRMIRFSGSGDLAQFKESELLTMEEYNKMTIKAEQEREDMRNEMYATKQEIFKSFGVNRGTEVYIKRIEGEKAVVDKSSIYKVTGFSRSKDETLLHLRKEAGEGRTMDEVRVKSKDEFEIVTAD